MARQFFLGLAMLGLSTLGAGWSEAGFVLTANAAGSQASTVAGVTTETFDSFATGTYTSLNTAVGSISSPGLAILKQDQYGGASGSPSTPQYVSVGAQSGQLYAVVTLPAPQAYFGFWWSAADPENEIGFYSRGQLVAGFNLSSALGQLSPAYDGNPNGGDPGEKFAYLNLFGTNGSTFDQVVFFNQNTSTGFESDNWSIRSGAVDGPFPGTVLASVPEPSSVAMTATGLLALFGVARRRGTGNRAA